jgi:hypothetical protein
VPTQQHIVTERDAERFQAGKPAAQSQQGVPFP